MPTLFDRVAQDYAKDLAARPHHPAVTFDADDFLAFCRGWLAKNPVSLMDYSTGGPGVVLADNSRLALHAGGTESAPGALEPSFSVPVIGRGSTAGDLHSTRGHSVGVFGDRPG